MKKLWDKTTQQKIHPVVETYIAGSDDVFDAFLMPFDIRASRAHAKGLRNIGVLDAVELESILKALDSLEQEFRAGHVNITPADEDCHTVIENYLVEKLGDTGKKIHAGRSRNDQVLVAMRLYMKNRLIGLSQKCVALASAFLDFADKYKDIPMPGYTHTQQAMLSSIGHYMTSFVEGLLDDADFAMLVLRHLDKNPLGSAAGFGVSMPLDRAFTTKELGFVRIQLNSLYCQNSRGKFESLFLEALTQIMSTLGRFAHDLLWFSSQEFDFFAIDDSLTTGSSMMPHKRNLDVMEILRGNVSVVIANQLMIKEMSKNLLSGYNRDLQLMKKPLMESARIVSDSLEVVEIALKGITPKKGSIEKKITKDIFMTDVVNKLVMEKHMPFRDAYGEAAGMISREAVHLGENIASKVSLGAPGNLNIGEYRERIEKQRILRRSGE